MVSVNQLRSEYRLEYQSTGADKVATDAARVASATNSVATAAESVSASTEKQERKVLSLTKAMDAYNARNDAMVRAQQQIERGQRLLNASFEQGLAHTQSYQRGVEILAQQQQRYQQMVQKSAANRNGRLDGYQAQNLFYQGSDVAVSLAGGVNPLMVAMQQGPQIAQPFVGPESASIKGAFTQAGEEAARLAARIGIVGGALGGLTAAVGVGAAAWASYRSEQSGLALQLEGIGRASGVTLGRLNAVAAASAGTGRVSVSEARGFGATYAGTGRIGPDILGGLISTTRDYAKLSGQDAPEAARELAAAFADPSRGADDLNKRLGFLNSTTREMIQRLDAQGDRLGAQRVMLDAYKTSLTGAAEATAGWGRITEDVANGISDWWTRFGQNLDKGFGGGALEQRLAAEVKRIRELEKLGPSGGLDAVDSIYSMGGSRDDQLSRARRNAGGLQAEMERRDKAAEQARQRLNSLEIGNLVSSLNPTEAALKRIEDSATLLQTRLRDGGQGFDHDGRAQRTMVGLREAAKLLREDLAAGGTALANSLRDAKFNLSTVGFTSQGRSAADINRRADDELRALRLDPNDPLMGDYQRNSVEERRRLELETLRQRAYLETGAGSGRYSHGIGQAPEQYRNLYYEAGTRYGVNPDLLVSQGYRESRFRANAVSSAGAQGIAQFMPETARGYGLANPFDPASAIDAQARLMRDLINQYNGDEVSALVGYNASTRVRNRFQASGRDVSVLPKETRDYIKAIMTSPPSALDQVRDQDARSRRLQLSREELRLTSEAGGGNAESLNARLEAARALSDAQSRGVETSKAYERKLSQEATERQRLVTAGRVLQFSRDTGFDREQLGRSDIDARAYARARSYIGDTDSDAAKLVINQSRLNDELRMTKDLSREALGGLVSDLRRGVDAGDALSNMMSRISDRLADLAIDQALSAAFKGSGATNGVGFFATIGKFLSGSFADGGVMTSGGPLPLNRYAGGGIARSPQLALFGEGRGPEAYVPLPDGRSIPVTMRGGGGAVASPVTVNLIGAPAGAQVNEIQDGRGGRRIDVTFDAQVAKSIAAPGSASGRALRHRPIAQR